MDDILLDDKVKELLKKSPLSHLETYQNELVEYLSSKLENYNVPICTIMEIAQYCYTATILTSNDEVRRAIKNIYRQERRYKR